MVKHPDDSFIHRQGQGVSIDWRDLYRTVGKNLNRIKNDGRAVEDLFKPTTSCVKQSGTIFEKIECTALHIHRHTTSEPIAKHTVCPENPHWCKRTQHQPFLRRDLLLVGIIDDKVLRPLNNKKAGSLAGLAACDDHREEQPNDTRKSMEHTHAKERGNPTT
jgi:hypothetical protein